MMIRRQVFIYYKFSLKSSLVLRLKCKEHHTAVDRAQDTLTLSLASPLSIYITLNHGFFIYIAGIVMSIILQILGSNALTKGKTM